MLKHENWNENWLRKFATFSRLGHFVKVTPTEFTLLSFILLLKISHFNGKFAKERNSFQIYTSVATTTLVGAREKSTTKNYLGYFNEWSSWTGQYPEISILPAKETYVVIYLLYLFQIGKSYSTICLTYQAINCFYSIVRHPKPCDSKLCLNILEGLKRATRYTVQTKSRIIVKHLYNLYSHFGGQRMSLSNLRIMLFESFP